VLEECLNVAPQVSERIFLEAVGRERAAGTGYSVLVQDLPRELWSPAIVEEIEAAILEVGSDRAQPELLALLASRKPERGVAVARAVLDQRRMSEVLGVGVSELLINDPDRLALEALNVLLALAPDDAWPLIEDGAMLASNVLFSNLGSLARTARLGLNARWQDWPFERVVRLAELLFVAFPPEEDPPDRSGLVQTSDELRDLRWRLLEHLVAQEGSDSDSEVELERARKIHPSARTWIDQLQATKEADDLVAVSRQTVGDGNGIPLRAALELLDSAHFRLIRSPDDLLEVVVEQLEELEADVGYDLDMLYCPSADGPPEKRRRESALQAYILRRLSDRLPGKVLDAETRVSRGHRTDIRILAPVISRQEVARLVIEVKWSDNRGAKRGVSTGLKNQLGKDYLLGEREHRHGIFLVGYNGNLGTWRLSVVGVGPRPKTGELPGSLVDALERQAREFRAEHPEIKIQPVVWDLRRSAD